MSPYREPAFVKPEAPVEEPRRRMHDDDWATLGIAFLPILMFAITIFGIIYR